MADKKARPERVRACFDFAARLQRCGFPLSQLLALL
jgi:hypothetical protein